MAFLTDEDYKVVIGATALNIADQSAPANRENAEKEAIEEISGYLRPKYNVDRIFKAEGANRNSHIVMITCDIALYHLYSSVAQRMGMEIRKERYERAIKWLEGVSKGDIVPDLPLATDEDGNPANPLRWGSAKPIKSIW